MNALLILLAEELLFFATHPIVHCPSKLCQRDWNVPPGLGAETLQWYRSQPYLPTRDLLCSSCSLALARSRRPFYALCPPLDQLPLTCVHHSDPPTSLTSSSGTTAPTSLPVSSALSGLLPPARSTRAQKQSVSAT